MTVTTMHPPRLDVLLYAHDGRGLGHASRSIAIAMALRRLDPGLRVLVVTGCSYGQELIDTAPVDWLKLPAYRTQVVEGRSVGVDGDSGFSDSDLGTLRAQTLRQLIEIYRPRVVLADHSPQGKHSELLSALELGGDTRWLLGVRGVIGSVRQVHSELATSVFARHYHALLWYGDSSVLGREHRDALSAQFERDAIETGYVSRFKELALTRGAMTGDSQTVTGTASIPWFGETGSAIATALSSAIAALHPSERRWHIYLPNEHVASSKSLFAELTQCELRPFGRAYADSLARSRVALIYGGYNSVADCLATGTPAVVLLREMRDDEQRLHLERLCAKTAGLSTLNESDASSGRLHAALRARLDAQSFEEPPIALDGAARAARFLIDTLTQR